MTLSFMSGTFLTKADVRINEFSVAFSGQPPSFQMELVHTDQQRYKTCAIFAPWGSRIQYVSRCLDGKSMTLFKVSHGDFFSEDQIKKRKFRALRERDPLIFGPVVFDHSKPFMVLPITIGVRTPAIDSLFSTRPALGWVTLGYVNGRLGIIDQAIAYNEPGIVIGTRQTKLMEPPRLSIQRQQHENGEILLLSFDAQSGSSYQLYVSENGTDWEEHGNSITGQQGEVTREISIQEKTQRFYRLVAQL